MGSGSSTPSPVACNGNPALCSRPYSSVVQVGTHGSPFVGTRFWSEVSYCGRILANDSEESISSLISHLIKLAIKTQTDSEIVIVGILPTQNQQVSVNGQLNAGIRFLQGQTHVKDGVLYMCHTSCDLEEAGKLTDYLGTIKTWMDKNQGQVVTVLLTNGDRVDVSMFKNDFESSGMASYAYSPGKKLAISEWPTLQTLVNDGKRAVVFLDYLADSNKAPYILDEFSYFFETAFDVTEFTNCALNRPPGSDGNGLMMLVNHFKDIEILPDILIPDVISTPKTNAATGEDSIGEHSDWCVSEWGGRGPNMVLVDNFNIGQVFQAERTLNRL